MPRIYPKFSVVRSYPGLQTAAAELRTQVPGCKRISAALHISLGKASAWKRGKGLPGPEELAKLEELYGALPATRAALEGYAAWRQARRQAKPRGKELARELIRKIERAQKRGATVLDEDDAAALALIDYFATYVKSYTAALQTLDTYKQTLETVEQVEALPSPATP